MIAKIHTLLIASLLMVVAGCSNDDKFTSRSTPIVNTYSISDVDDQGATLHGEILDLGDGVTDHGFFYGPTSINPTTAASCDILSLGPTDSAGTFSAAATTDLVKGTTYYVRAFATGMKNNITVFGQEFTFTSLGSSPPTIKDFDPKQGIIGDTIIIEGTGFSPIPAKNTVYVGDAYGPVAKATVGKLWVVVPNSTTTGENEVTVEVSKQKVAATSKFNLIKMTVTSFEPNLVAFGDTVWFHGTNLPLVNDMSGATIFLRSAHTASSTRTLIGCVVPNDAATTSSDVTFVAGTQSAHFAGPIHLKGPVITSFDPVLGVAGTVVTITGANFNPDLTKNTVYFGADAIQILDAQRGRLVVKIPLGATPGSNTFTVTTLTALTTTSSGSFTVTPP